MKKFGKKPIKVFNKFYLSPERLNFNVKTKDSFLYMEGHFLPKEKKDAERILKSKASATTKITKLKEFDAKFTGVLFEKGKLYVFADKFAFYRNIFYTQRDGKLAVANNFNNIMEQFEFTLDDTDERGFNEAITFENTIGNKTFLKGVYYLMVFEILSYDFSTKKLEIKEGKNWNIEDPKKMAKGTMEENFERVDELLDNSAKKIKERYGDATFGIGLSGGFDSRVTAYYMTKNKAKLKPYIFGDDNSDAYQISNRIAKVLGLSLKELAPEMDFFQKYYKLQYAENPMMNYQFLWYYSVYEKLPKFDVLLNGFNGDAAFGEITWEDYDNEPMSVLDTLNKVYINPFSRKMLKHFDPELVIKESVASGVGLRADQMRMQWSFVNRLQKFSKENPGMNFLSKFEDVSIFADKDLNEYLINTPLPWRKDKTMYFEFIKWKMPEIACIRGEREPFPLTETSFVKKKVKTYVHMADYHLKLNIFYKRQHKDIYKWIRNNDGFWEFALGLIERNRHKYMVNHEYINDFIDRVRNNRLKLRTGKQLMPFFQYLSILIYFWINLIIDYRKY